MTAINRTGLKLDNNYSIAWIRSHFYFRILSIFGKEFCKWKQESMDNPDCNGQINTTTEADTATTTLETVYNDKPRFSD